MVISSTISVLLSLQDFSTILWVYASKGLPPPPSWVTLVWQYTHPSRCTLNPADAAMLLWSAAMLGEHPGRDWLQQLWQQQLVGCEVQQQQRLWKQQRRQQLQQKQPQQLSEGWIQRQPVHVRQQWEQQQGQQDLQQQEQQRQLSKGWTQPEAVGVWQQQDRQDLQQPKQEQQRQQLSQNWVQPQAMEQQQWQWQQRGEREGAREGEHVREGREGGMGPVSVPVTSALDLEPPSVAQFEGANGAAAEGAHGELWLQQQGWRERWQQPGQQPDTADHANGAAGEGAQGHLWQQQRQQEQWQRPQQQPDPGDRANGGAEGAHSQLSRWQQEQWERSQQQPDTEDHAMSPLAAAAGLVEPPLAAATASAGWDGRYLNRVSHSPAGIARVLGAGPAAAKPWCVRSIVLTIWAAVRMGDPPPKPWLSRVLGTLQLQLADLEPPVACQLLAVLARYRYTPSVGFMAQLLSRLQLDLHELHPKGFACVFWTLGVLRFRPAETWWDSVEGHLGRALGEMGQRELMNVLWGMVRLRWEPPRELLGPLGARVCELILQECAMQQQQQQEQQQWEAEEDVVEGRMQGLGESSRGKAEGFVEDEAGRSDGIPVSAPAFAAAVAVADQVCTDTALLAAISEAVAANSGGGGGTKLKISGWQVQLLQLLAHLGWEGPGEKQQRPAPGCAAASGGLR